jgi:Eukaryotic aspartyl protease
MVKCGRVKSLPEVSFSIGGRNFPLTPEQYVLRIDAGMSAPLPTHLVLHMCYICVTYVLHA